MTTGRDTGQAKPEALASTGSSHESPLISLPAPLREKYENLRKRTRRLGSVLVAFSGGADSSVVARICHDELPGRALAVTGRSESLSPAMEQLAQRVTAHIGIPHEFIETREQASPAYVANPANRCYFCRQELHRTLREIATQRGFACVADGVNASDLGDHRPGLQASRQWAVVSPLMEANLTKEEVREVARFLGLPNWDLPSDACLSSRIPYGERITPEKLQRVARAEELLKSLGFRVVRVRHHNGVARIEVPSEEIARLVQDEIRPKIVEAFRTLGFTFVSVDLVGYRSGSLNEALGAGHAAPKDSSG